MRAAAPQEKRSAPAQLLAGLGAAALIASSGVNPEAASAAWVPRPSIQEKVEAPTEAIKVVRDVFGNIKDDARSAAKDLQVSGLLVSGGFEFGSSRSAGSERAGNLLEVVSYELRSENNSFSSVLILALVISCAGMRCLYDSG